MKSARPSAASLLAAVAVLWAILLAGAAQGISSGDPRGLYVLGSRFVHPPELDGVRKWDGTGYDGQFFAALAVDPLLLDANTPRYLDGPAYRAGRIGLPLAAWIVALGNRRGALIAYPLLTWALSLLGVWVAARWLEEDGRSVLWAAPLAVSVGMVSSMLRCLPDAAAASLLLLAIWLDRRGRRGSIAALSFAALVRETSLIGAAALAVVRWRSGERRAAVLALAIPAGLATAWRAWVLSRPGFGPYPLVDFGWPLRWVADWVRIAPGTTLSARLAIAAVLLSIVAVLALPRPWSVVAWTYAGFAALALVLNIRVYDDAWSLGRVLAALPVLVAVLPGGRTALAVPAAFAIGGCALLLESNWIGAGLLRLAGH